MKIPEKLCSSDCKGWTGNAWVDPGGTIFGPGPYLKVECGDDHMTQRIACKYGYPEYKTKLWVRETYAKMGRGRNIGFIYRADHGHTASGTTYDLAKWRPSLFMPKKVARIWLKLTKVRLEPVQKISGFDAKDEGYETYDADIAHFGGGKKARRWYREMWDGMHGKKKGLSWEDNPWVWVLEFERMKDAPTLR